MTEHAARLLARLGDRGMKLASDPQLPALLDGLFDRAEGRLPHRPIRRDAMVDRLADALLAGDEPPDCEALARLNAPDLYLALALVEKDIRALEIAQSELIPAVRQAVGRIDASASFVEGVSQRVLERLLAGDGTAPPVIVQYRGTGPLARWVRVIASRVALELKRSDVQIEGEGEPAQEPDPAQASEASDLELETMWRTYADEYRAVLAEAVAGLSRRERLLLRHRYLDDLDGDALGRIYRVNASTTSRWLKQIEDRLAAATRAALMAKLSVSEAQTRRIEQRMEQLVASQLPLSLPQTLRGSPSSDGSKER